MFRKLNECNCKGKHVIMRVDFNVPMQDGKITSDRRIREALPSITHILKQEPKQLILMTHIGRPKDNEPELKTDKAAERLGKLLGEKVKKVQGWKPAKDRIVMLENLRFNKAEKSKDAEERDGFGKELAGHADLYINEAFSNCHRQHASMTSVPKFIPGYAGFAVSKEYTIITNAVKNPKRPLVSIIGGLKTDKINAIKNMLRNADMVLLGGALAYLFLKISGIDIGSTKIDSEGLKETEQDIKELLDEPKLLLPVDCVIGNSFSPDAESKIVEVENITKGWQCLDIGPETIKLYKEALSRAKTVIWNGPLGVFEFDKFANGTKALAEVLAKSSATTIIGGGDSAAAIEKFGLAKKMTHISTGGGASLELMQGNELAALKALEKSVTA
jgi:phosphoglycerate kinase